MSEKKYPDEIYPGVVEIFGAKVAKAVSTADLEKAYDLGRAHSKEQADPLAGFSNLTQAIQDGVRIDWEKLDGRVAKCVHPELGTLSYGLHRNYDLSEDVAIGWYDDSVSVTDLWVHALKRAWGGVSGWELWIEDEVPTKNLYADLLEPATGFIGREFSTQSSFFVYLNSDGQKRVYDVRFHKVHKPERIEVIEVCGIGTLQPHKKEEN